MGLTGIWDWGTGMVYIAEADLTESACGVADECSKVTWISN